MSMERYEYLETISSGAYGVCYKVLDTTTGLHCAAKGIKLAHEDAEVMRLTLREVKVLKTLPQHVNIVKLLEAFRSHSGRVYLVFEYVERSLYQELDRHPTGALPGPMVKSVAWQLLHALGHCHDHGIMHRDIKPANILLTGDTPGIGSGGVVKLCDFGFARAVANSGGRRGGGSNPQGLHGGGAKGADGAAKLSSYVMTRWYRPPEVLVGDVYGTAIDVWSYGCTLAEMATGRPLFPGRSTLDQLWRIMRCLGPLPPGQTDCLRRDLRLQPLWAPPPRLKTLRQRLPDLDPRLFEVISACLTLDPCHRPTVRQLLQMPYFWDVRRLNADTDLARQLPYAADLLHPWAPAAAAPAAIAAACRTAAAPAPPAAGGIAPGRAAAAAEATSASDRNLAAPRPPAAAVLGGITAALAGALARTAAVPTSAAEAASVVTVEASPATAPTVVAKAEAPAALALRHAAAGRPYGPSRRACEDGTGGAGDSHSDDVIVVDDMVGGALPEQASLQTQAQLQLQQRRQQQDRQQLRHQEQQQEQGAMTHAAAPGPVQPSWTGTRDKSRIAYDVSYISWSTSSGNCNNTAPPSNLVTVLGFTAAAAVAAGVEVAGTAMSAAATTTTATTTTSLNFTGAPATTAVTTTTATTDGALTAGGAGSTDGGSLQHLSDPSGGTPDPGAPFNEDRLSDRKSNPALVRGSEPSAIAVAAAAAAAAAVVSREPEPRPRALVPTPHSCDFSPDPACEALSPLLPVSVTAVAKSSVQCLAVAAAAAGSGSTSGSSSSCSSSGSCSLASKAVHGHGQGYLEVPSATGRYVSTPVAEVTSAAGPATMPAVASIGSAITAVPSVPAIGSVAAVATATAVAEAPALPVQTAPPPVRTPSAPTVAPGCGLAGGGYVSRTDAEATPCTTFGASAPSAATSQLNTAATAAAAARPIDQLQAGLFTATPATAGDAPAAAAAATGDRERARELLLAAPGAPRPRFGRPGELQASQSFALQPALGNTPTSRFLSPPSRTASGSGARRHHAVTAAATTAAGVVAAAGDVRCVSLSQLAIDSDASLRSGDLTVIRSPCGAPQLSQFLVQGAPLPHRRRPPLPASLLFLSSPTETQETVPELESLQATACHGDAQAASGGVVPGCTLEYDQFEYGASTGPCGMPRAGPYAQRSPGPRSSDLHSKQAPGRLWHWAVASLRTGSGGGAPLHPPGTFTNTMRWLNSHSTAGGEPPPALDAAAAAAARYHPATLPYGAAPAASSSHNPVDGIPIAASGSVAGGGRGGNTCRLTSRTVLTLPSWLFPSNRGRQLTSGPGGRAELLSVSVSPAATPIASLRTARSQQVLHAGQHYLHPPGDVNMTSTLSSVCLPPVEEPDSASSVREAAGAATAAEAAAAAPAGDSSYHISDGSGGGAAALALLPLSPSTRALDKDSVAVAVTGSISMVGALRYTSALPRGKSTGATSLVDCTASQTGPDSAATADGGSCGGGVTAARAVAAGVMLPSDLEGLQPSLQQLYEQQQTAAVDPWALHPHARPHPHAHSGARVRGKSSYASLDEDSSGPAILVCGAAAATAAAVSLSATITAGAATVAVGAAGCSKDPACSRVATSPARLGLRRSALRASSGSASAHGSVSGGSASRLGLRSAAASTAPSGRRLAPRCLPGGTGSALAGLFSCLPFLRRRRGGGAANDAGGGGGSSGHGSSFHRGSYDASYGGMRSSYLRSEARCSTGSQKGAAASPLYDVAPDGAGGGGQCNGVVMTYDDSSVKRLGPRALQTYNRCNGCYTKASGCRSTPCGLSSGSVEPLTTATSLPVCAGGSGSGGSCGLSPESLGGNCTGCGTSQARGGSGVAGGAVYGSTISSSGSSGYGYGYSYASGGCSSLAAQPVIGRPIPEVAEESCLPARWAG